MSSTTSTPADWQALEQVAEAITEAAGQEGVSEAVASRLERMRLALAPRRASAEGFELTGELLETARSVATGWAMEVMEQFAGITIDPGAPDAMHRAARLLSAVGCFEADPPDTVTMEHEHVVRHLAEIAQCDLLVAIDGHAADEGVIAWIRAIAAGADFPPGTEKARALTELIIALEPHRGHVEGDDVLALARKGATR